MTGGTRAAGTSRGGTFTKVLGVLVPVVAVAVMVVGLWPRDPRPVDPVTRAHAVASNLRCPFCNGESIADSPSGVARDLEAIIVEQVESGMSDREIYEFFAARYGERVLLDPPGTGWGVVLWAAPAALLVIGVAAITGLRRSRPSGTATTATSLAVDAGEQS